MLFWDTAWRAKFSHVPVTASPPSVATWNPMSKRSVAVEATLMVTLTVIVSPIMQLLTSETTVVARDARSLDVHRGVLPNRSARHNPDPAGRGQLAAVVVTPT